MTDQPIIDTREIVAGSTISVTEWGAPAIGMNGPYLRTIHRTITLITPDGRTITDSYPCD